MVLGLECQQRLGGLLLPIEEKRVAKSLPLNFRLRYFKKNFSVKYASISLMLKLKTKLKIIVKKRDYSLAVRRNKIKRWVERFLKAWFEKGVCCGCKEGFLELGFK